MEEIRSFITAYSTVLGAVLATALAVVVLSRQRVRFWLRDFWVTFPFFGDIARLAKDSTKGNDGWMRAEEKLCGIYKPYLVLFDESTFNERIEYLRKSADLGRAPTPMWAWVLLVVLVIAEGLGFSYLLGSWMAREGSANTHTLLMLAIVLVLCVILVALTHAAGHQYYRTSLLRSCFQRFKDTGGREYAVQLIALKDAQTKDDSAPDYKQIVNRVAKHSHDKGSYTAVVIAVIAIVFIGVVSTYMRMQNLEAEMSRETALQQSPAAGNPFASVQLDVGRDQVQLTLPADVTAPQQQADDKAKSETSSATEKEGLAAFAMIGFIFVITQIVGIGAGYKYGFAGKESKEAYRATGGYSTYDDYWAYFEPIRDLVNGRLKGLQQRLEQDSHTQFNLSKTFDDYLLEQKRRSEEMRGGIDRSIQRPRSDEGLVPDAVGAAKAELSRMTDKKQQQEYFQGLDAPVQEALKPWLKQRKEEAARKEAETKAAELEDLF